MEKRHIYTTLWCLLAALTLCSCGDSRKPQARHTVAVSIEPLRYFVDEIAQGRVDVITMVPRGSSPETYEPTPRQMTDLTRCSAYLRIKVLPFDALWLPRMRQNLPQMQVMDADSGLSVRTGNDGLTQDPHIWMSARNAHLIAGNIAQALCHVDPANAATYQTNAKRLQSHIAQVDSTVRRLLAGSRHRTFAIYHPALLYFAADYGLTQLALENGGKEPTAAQMKMLIRQCRAQGVHSILVQQEFTEHNAEIVAKETGARIVSINPLNYRWDEEMIHIAKELSHD
jgi:zinc transport system substrate-binding protein